MDTRDFRNSALGRWLSGAIAGAVLGLIVEPCFWAGPPEDGRIRLPVAGPALGAGICCVLALAVGGVRLRGLVKHATIGIVVGAIAGILIGASLFAEIMTTIDPPGDADMRGKVFAGFQLVVDAANAVAVALLRERKRRPDKPFAVMLSSLEDARRWCRASQEEAETLASHQAPIVLLRRRDQGGPGETAGGSVAGVAPGNPYLGVMLPYTPLHHLFMAAVDRPIVCTSGNLSEEPMAEMGEPDAQDVSGRPDDTPAGGEALR
jgi:hypothetical protein